MINHVTVDYNGDNLQNKEDDNTYTVVGKKKRVDENIPQKFFLLESFRKDFNNKKKVYQSFFRLKFVIKRRKKI